MRDDLYANLRSLLDIPHDRVEPSIALGAFGQHDVLGVHSDRLEHDPGAVAVVAHPLQFIEIPTAVGAPVEEGIDEWSHDRECLVERLCVRKQGSFRLPCVACFPGCAVWYIEALGKRDLSPPFFRAQRG